MNVRAIAELRAERARLKFTPEALCGENPKQFAFVTSRAKRLVARCSRRGGKTTSVDDRMLLLAQEPPFIPQLYCTMTRRYAKDIVWNDLLRANYEHGLGGIPNHGDLILKMPKGADIVLAGANNEREIAKIRGKRYKGVNIDEAQSIPERVLKPLIDDIVGPTLLDYDGYLALTGTPGPVLGGTFYEADQGTKAGKWERHHWTLVDNVYLPVRRQGASVESILAKIREEHGWDAFNPTYRREYLGEWVRDDDALALHYDPLRNACDFEDAPRAGWVYVIAFDIGFEDADAIAVLGWAPGERVLRLVKETVVRRQGISELGAQLLAQVDRYKPMKIVGDLGALGKKIAEELRRRWGLNIEPAEKTRKAEHLTLLDDALRTGAFLAPPVSQFAEDCAHMQWDPAAKAKGKLELTDSYHSDIGDAVLYGYRVAFHWAERKPEPPKTELQRLDDWERAEGRRIEAEQRRGWLDDTDDAGWNTPD